MVKKHRDGKIETKRQGKWGDYKLEIKLRMDNG